jgi:hypothetical protein
MGGSAGFNLYSPAQAREERDAPNDFARGVHVVEGPHGGEDLVDGDLVRRDVGQDPELPPRHDPHDGEHDDAHHEHHEEQAEDGQAPARRVGLSLPGWQVGYTGRDGCHIS